MLQSQRQEPQEDLDVDNRRRAHRVNRQLDIRYRVAGEPVNQSVALNLSQTGARIVLRGSNANTFGPQMTLEIDRQVDLLARTVWEHAMPGGQCRIAGVVFESVGPLQKAALTRLLENLEAR